MLCIWGAAPNPEVYRFGFRRGNEKETVIFTASPQIRPGAQVAPQRCLILPDGKAGNIIPQKL